MKRLHPHRCLGIASIKHIQTRPIPRPVLIQNRIIQQRPFYQAIPQMNNKPAFSSTSTTSNSMSGYFQTITLNNQDRNSSPPSSDFPLNPTRTSSLTITDTLYGTHTITSASEPLLFSLLQSPYLTRLSGVNQHGITGLMGLTPPITRLEHSIGAFLIVRSLGASLSEQVAALLHDVSHTALSHVVDWAFKSTYPGSGEESYHEVHKARYLETSDLVDIVTSFAEDLGRPGGNSMDVFHEEKFSLVEYPAPHLCADRIDYALRDSVAFGKLSLEEARRVFNSLKAYPDTNSPDRLIVMDDEELALKFARAYNGIDRDVWSNPANIDMYQATGRIIGDVIRHRRMEEEDLWRLSDEEFWEGLRKATDDEGRGVMKRLETEGLPRQEDVKGLPVGTKIRTLDPDVLAGDGAGYQALSVVCPAWGVERGEYIRARKALIGMNTR